MRTIRLILCWIYALAAFIFLRVSISTYKETLYLSFGRPWSNARSIAAGLLVAAVGVVYGMAWWTILLRKPSARIWAMIASILQILLCVLFCGLDLYRGPGIMWQPVLVLIAIGVAGLVAFWHRDTSNQLDVRRTPMPVAGDGTNKWISKSVWIVGTVAFLYGLNLWWHWANLNGLSSSRNISYILQLVLADLVIVLVHELGHAVTGLALGMKLRAFIVGPFQWRIREGRWVFKLQPGGFFSTGGATALVPTNPQQCRWEQVCMIAAGPFASILLGLVALSAALSAPGHPWEPAWLFLACVATLSLLVGVLNVIPFQTGSSYSDGAYIYQIVQDGPWAAYHRAMAVVSASLVTPLRPRDFDIESLQRAETSIMRGPRAFHLQLLKSLYYSDRRQLREAADAAAQAELIYQESASDIPAELHTGMIFDKAVLQRNAAATRLWWDRMEKKKPTHFNVDYWLARGSLLWIENNRSEAREAWEKANALAEKLPNFGAYEFDRYRCNLLRKALDEPSPAEVAGPLRLSGSTLAPLPPDPLPAS